MEYDVYSPSRYTLVVEINMRQTTSTVLEKKRILAAVPTGGGEVGPMLLSLFLWKGGRATLNEG